MTEKRLGKIEKAYFGISGYQDCMIGLHLTLSADGWCMNTNYSAWDSERIECSPHAKWTEEDRSEQYDEIMRKISKLMADAKVDTIQKLVGIPIEVEVENMTFVGFRVLTEVL